MNLVILAAGHGRRFGGLKQLAAVGPEDQALIDYNALDAVAAGFTRLVLVVREEIRDEVVAHVNKHWPSSLEWDIAVQGPPAGTAQAVLSAAELVDGPFGVSNADDLYGVEPFTLLCNRLASTTETAAVEAASEGDVGAPAPHLLVSYRMADTIFGTATVTRGVCRTDPAGHLIDIVEQKVTAIDPELTRFAGVPLAAGPGAPATPLSGDESVSMNLWGFHERLFDHLRAAVGAFDPPPPPPDADKPPELLLPDVVQELVRTGADDVAVAEARGTCIGITHPDDLPFVRAQLGNRRPGDAPSPV
jgi:CTP:molybdopterin cytidylyltransferase MocA